jgi:predicted nuclease of predicted toxin-antitoxin system
LLNGCEVRGTTFLNRAHSVLILVTIDTDFAQLVYVDRASHCGIVRLPDVPAEGRIKLMEAVFREHASDLYNQAIITVRGQRIRISKPLGAP